MVKLRKYFFV